MRRETTDAESERVQALVEDGVRRRTVAAGLLTVAGVALIDDEVLAQAGITGIDILNVALNLEYLEAEFDTVATTGGGSGNWGLASAAGCVFFVRSW